jgi:hypothetical protein
LIARRKKLERVLFIILFGVVILFEPVSAFSVRITVDKGCGSAYVPGDPIEFHVTVSEGAYLSIWVATSGGSWDIVRDTYLEVGTHTFSGVVGEAEGTHTIYARGRNAYGDTEVDSCSFYVSHTPVLAPPFPIEPEETDSDGDTILDDHDLCYNPGCYEVDSQGCPRDSDEDGVPDCDDACDFFPGEPTGDGCPELVGEQTEKDSDGDSWSDEQELRAGTNPHDVDTDEDGIWDSQDPNPLEPEEKDTKVAEQQTQLLPTGEHIRAMVPTIVIAVGLAAGYYFLRNRIHGEERLRRMVLNRKMKEKKKQEKIRKLKTRFVYGELSKEEYQEKVKELEQSFK